MIISAWVNQFSDRNREETSSFYFTQLISRMLQRKSKSTWNLKKAVFWDVGPCRSCVNRRFSGTCFLHLLARAHAGSSLSDILLFSPTLKMEAIRSSETSVNTISTRHHIPEDCFLHSHRRENLKSYIHEICLTHLPVCTVIRAVITVYIYWGVVFRWDSQRSFIIHVNFNILTWV
jgi:hypothetical protein